jgi:hypothetical protein
MVVGDVSRASIRLEVPKRFETCVVQDNPRSGVPSTGVDRQETPWNDLHD